jgi:hypothetical protein
LQIGDYAAMNEHRRLIATHLAQRHGPVATSGVVVRRLSSWT